MSPIESFSKGLEGLSQLDRLYKSEMPHPSSSLFEAAHYHFRNPGKSFRAQLALSAGIAVNQDIQDSLQWAAACELLHNASLIHDDISDASTHRRGQTSINQKFSSDMALCLGDWMVAKAFEFAARNKVHGSALVAILAQAMQDTCGGQISDISQQQCVDLDDWQKIAKGKTAPLLATPIRGAMISADLTCEADCLDQLVAYCGLAYQGRNDINDIVPSSHRSSDLDGRKPNLVVSIFADLKSTENDRFTSWYGSGDIDAVGYWQKRIATSDAIGRANQLAAFWIEQADLLVPKMPEKLQLVAEHLVTSVKQTAVIEQQEQTA